MFSWTSYQRCGQTMWSGRSFPLSSLSSSSHVRDTGWFSNVSWWGVTLVGFEDCCGPATVRIFSGRSESIVRSGQLLEFIIRSLVRPPSFTQEITSLSHFNAQTAFSATECYLGPEVWTWLWAAWAWISSHRTECLRRLWAGRNLRTKEEKSYKTT